MALIDPHSYTDTSQGVIRHIDFDLDLDFANKRILGTAVYRVEIAAPGLFDLDSRGLEIRGVRDATGKDMEWSVGKTEGFMGEKISLPVSAATKGFSIDFATSPDSSALQWLDPANTAGKEHPFFFSQCQPIHARAVFPCQDSPLVRFTYNAKVKVPAPLLPIMSASPPVKEKISPEGFGVYSFNMPQAIPSYLFAIAVGNLAAEDLGPRSRVYAEPEMLDACAYEFAEVDGMLTAAEDLFGPYLWDRFDFVVMPPAFPYGGMENPRLTFLTPTLLAGDRSLVNVLAHELAHSWTGNLVTNATMNDFWLNEGFTVWAERRILERLDGVEALSLSAALGRIGLNEAVAQFGADSPLTRLETDLAGTDPDDVYSLVPYEKGFLFVALLEKTLGREDMDAFVKAYIERFKFVSITTAQFEAFVSEVRPGLLDQVDGARWIHGTGIPDAAPVFESPKLAEIKGLAEAWVDDIRPSERTVAAWSSTEMQVYIQALPKEMNFDQCEHLKDLLGLGKCNNAEILNSWFVIAATSGFEPAFGRMEAFLSSVGRMKFLKPIYGALAKNPSTVALARSIFEKNAANYHPIARGGLEKILA